VLVLARLLYKSVSESVDPPKVLEELRKRLGGLRKRLLGYIERVLVKTGVERSVLANTLCAYALVSSSAPKDVLRHFLQTRLEHMDAESNAPNEDNVDQMLEMYKWTLLDTRALFPRLFAEALSRLSRTPLLQDKQLNAMFELNLDVYNMWIAEDVRSFTPWVRHEQLVTSEVGDPLASWAKQAQGLVSEVVEEVLHGEDDAGVMLQVRKRVLSQYLSIMATVRDGSHSEAFAHMRQLFATTLEKIPQLRAPDIPGLQAILEGKGQAFVNNDVHDMWALAQDEQDMANGAMKLRKAVLNRRHGRTAIIQACIVKLDTWINGIDSLWALVQQMRSTRWDDDPDVDIHDLEDGDAIRQDLNKTDPERLQNALRKAVFDTLQALYKLVDENSGHEHQAASFLRFLREVEQRRNYISGRYGVKMNNVPSRGTLATLHRHLAASTAEGPVQRYTTASKKQAYTSTALWDGSPPLPLQPSPATYRFLSALQKAMCEAGDDLWSVHAVDELKDDLNEKLVGAFESLTSSAGKGNAELPNGHAPDSEEMSNGNEKAEAVKTLAKDQRKDKLMQSLFDALYLRRIMSTAAATSTATGLQKVTATLTEQLGLDNASHDRLQKSANEYWKRTYLLFGLLAPNST